MQASDAVEENRHGAEIGVLAHCNAEVVLGLRRGLYKADVVAGDGALVVERGERPLGESEVSSQVLEEE